MSLFMFLEILLSVATGQHPFQDRSWLPNRDVHGLRINDNVCSSRVRSMVGPTRPVPDVFPELAEYHRFRTTESKQRLQTTKFCCL